MGFMLTLIEALLPYAGPAISLGYPLYASVEAIESPFRQDDEQWLTYWVIYSFLALFEMAFDRVLEMIPIWPACKILLVLWLILPQFRGACFIYRTYIKQLAVFWNSPHYEEEHHDEFTEEQRQLLRTMSPEARMAVAQYISEHGSHAFDKLITAACKQAQWSRNSPRTPKSRSPIRKLVEKMSPR